MKKIFALLMVMSLVAVGCDDKKPTTGKVIDDKAAADKKKMDEKTAADQVLPTGIDKSIEPMLPDPIYIPAVKDLADDIKTTESTPFGKILAILLFEFK